MNTDKVSIFTQLNGLCPPWLNYEFGLGFTYEKLYFSAASLFRNALHRFVPSWVRFKESRLRRTFDDLSKNKGNLRGLGNLSSVNLLVAGHDGAMDERVCHIIELFLEYKRVPFGIFGVELPERFKSRSIKDEHTRVLSQAQFFYCRTEASKAVVNRNFPNIDAKVAPDPAFGMRP